MRLYRSAHMSAGPRNYARLVSILLISSTAMADPPADAPLAPDVPGVSVKLHKGDPAPFDGRELSFEENLRRGKGAADCATELADAKANYVMLPRPAVAIIISIAAAAIAAAAGVTIAAAEHKL